MHTAVLFIDARLNGSADKQQECIAAKIPASYAIERTPPARPSTTGLADGHFSHCFFCKTRSLRA